MDIITQNMRFRQPLVQIISHLPRLLQIAVPAQHLQVLGNSLSACVPGRDMVAVHLLVLEVLVANRTDTLLAFVCLALFVNIFRAELSVIVC